MTNGKSDTEAPKTGKSVSFDPNTSAHIDTLGHALVRAASAIHDAQGQVMTLMATRETRTTVGQHVIALANQSLMEAFTTLTEIKARLSLMEDH